MGFIDPAFGAISFDRSIDLAGQPFMVKVAAGCLYDPESKRMRC
jgi:hypothetical protein